MLGLLKHLLRSILNYQGFFSYITPGNVFYGDNVRELMIMLENSETRKFKGSYCIDMINK